MLGKDLVPILEEKVIPTDLPDLDVASPESVEKIIRLSPTIVLHLAAYTDVDGCESNLEHAYKVNAWGTKNVATACRKLDIPMLYISTDYIFDGEKPTPYIEWDNPSPLSVYGQTKLEGEIWVKRLVKNYWIIRTSGLYGEGGKNFVSTILRKAEKEDEIKVVCDQIGSPTYTKDLANAIKRLIQTHSFGIYHITNSGWISWYEFAKTIVKICSIKCNIIPISSDEVKRPAKRPKNFRLLNFMWELSFKGSMRVWREALNEYITHYRRKYKN
jgi:dTDP-4-dehydrorhamnose reductase